MLQIIKQSSLFRKKDRLWFALWMAGILLLTVWDLIFLNTPALKRVSEGFVNTGIIAFLVILFTLALGWAAANLLHSLKAHGKIKLYLFVTFLMNLLRSIPQIVGILFGYILVAFLIKTGFLQRNIIIFPFMALIMSLFIFNEMADLMLERISHFRKLDFYSAMRVCGVPEKRIINFDILWKNSRVHIFNKLISVLGIAVFLQCSVDFIISVGLSRDVSAVDLPVTLGSLLAKIDSKQDILAIGYTLTHPGYFGNLLFGHLQGLSVAFLIVFTLICIYHVSNGYAERNRL